jgi:hypothetical protein
VRVIVRRCGLQRLVSSVHGSKASTILPVSGPVAKGLSKRRLTSRIRCISLATAAAVITAGWAAYRFSLRQIDYRPVMLIPIWERIGSRDMLRMPERFLVGEIADYDDEFFAYLMFTYLRGTRMLRNRELLLTYTRAGPKLSYSIQIHLPNDLLSSLPLLWDAKAAQLIDRASWRHVTPERLDRLRSETQLFQTAYNLPARRKLEEMTRQQLIAFIKAFVQFKSATDPRIRRRIEPVPRSLTPKEADQLAEDIVSVAEFYSLPLDFFLGIGAMENNYMNVPGDLQHAIWKRAAEKGDIILKRSRGKVLVINSSSGVWQITRETIRYAHRLYLNDDRQYRLLPVHLRPARELDLTALRPAILTTYAGLLFRDLLDRCQGDIGKAVGAYNGGLGNPNAQYAERVRVVAEYARRVLEARRRAERTGSRTPICLGTSLTMRQTCVNAPTLLLRRDLLEPILKQ